jgi:hypothetical protein
MSRLQLLSSIALVAGLTACGEVKPTIIDAPAGDIDAAVAIDATDVDAPPNAVTLTVVRGGNAIGTVTSDPAGIACGASCAASYPPGTLVTLTATPGAGAGFTGWGGACAGTLTTCSVQLGSMAAAVNANFDVLRHHVTVTTAGNGTGAVRAAAVGIDCPGTCMATVDHGTMVTFTAAPQAGSTFLGWSGACTGTGACAVTVDDDVQLSAAFGQSQSLIVTKSGSGTGGVTSAPAGINCGGDCVEVYPPGTVVTLTATPAADSVFAGWTGACTNASGTCVVTVNAATTVNAIFNLRQFTLTVTKTGTGTGTVTAVDGTINCGAVCTHDYSAGAMVTLVPNGGMDTVFAGWSGDCTNATGPCQVTMSAARSVTARFDPSPTIVLTLSVYGSGSVTAGPGPITGPTTCTSTDPNTTTCTLTYNRSATQLVTLRTSHPNGFQLIELQNCTPVDATTCSVPLTGSRTVSAYFCPTIGPCPL